MFGLVYAASAVALVIAGTLPPQEPARPTSGDGPVVAVPVQSNRPAPPVYVPPASRTPGPSVAQPPSGVRASPATVYEAPLVPAGGVYTLGFGRACVVADLANLGDLRIAESCLGATRLRLVRAADVPAVGRLPARPSFLIQIDGTQLCIYRGADFQPIRYPIRAEGCRGGPGGYWVFTRLSRSGEYTIAPPNGNCWVGRGMPASGSTTAIELDRCEGGVAFRLMPVS